MSTVTLTEADNGRSVQAHPSDEIVLRLPENATTGYRWHVDRAEGILEQEEDDYERPPGWDEPGPDVQIGRGGVRRFRFRVCAPGTSRLELKHWQEWDERSVTERFAVDIEVTD
jgi:inhibitor of cysteine peptidase